MKINFQVLVVFSIVMGFLSSSISMAHSTVVFGNLEIVKTYPTDSTGLFMSPFIDSFQDELNILSISDDDPSGLDFDKTTFLPRTVFNNSNALLTAEYFFKGSGFLSSNMAPVRNRLLYLLFHTLQIPF